jgi:hypothetical protein
MNSRAWRSGRAFSRRRHHLQRHKEHYSTFWDWTQRVKDRAQWGDHDHHPGMEAPHAEVLFAPASDRCERRRRDHELSLPWLSMPACGCACRSTTGSSSTDDRGEADVAKCGRHGREGKLVTGLDIALTARSSDRTATWISGPTHVDYILGLLRQRGCGVIQPPPRLPREPRYVVFYRDRRCCLGHTHVAWVHPCAPGRTRATYLCSLLVHIESQRKV